MTPAEQLKAIEKMITEQTPALAKSAPKRLEEMKAVLKELKSTPGHKVSPASQQVIKNLVVWQLDLKRETMVGQVAALKARVDKGDAAATKTSRALQDALKVIDEAKKTMTLAPAQAKESASRVDALTKKATASIKDAQASLAPVAPPAKPKAAKAAPAPLAPFKAGSKTGPRH